MKKILSVLLVLAMILSFAACGSEGGDEGNSDVKIGVILVGDENEGYTQAHIEGIKAAMAATGITEDQVTWKYKIPENEQCYDEAASLADAGCSYIFSNSYSHQAYMQQAAAEFPDVTFIALTGDTAKSSGLPNLKNAFPQTYESRYVSGVVAGMKVKEMMDAGELKPENFDADGNVKIGYIGAFPYAEVVSGYTGFFLGIKSIVENVSMEVQYTNSWFDLVGEGEAANSLMADGCVIIGQHADSTGAPAAVQAAHSNGKNAYSVGYNVSMLSVAPDVALTSASNDWAVYYTYAFNAILNGEEIPTDWSEGYNEGAVCVTELGTSCAEGTADKVAEVEAAIKDGSLHVFDVNNFTVGGAHISSYTDAYGMDGAEAIKDGYFAESTLRSAPYFDIRIDGIKELN